MSEEARERRNGAYAREFARALADPVQFWREQADALAAVIAVGVNA